MDTRQRSLLTSSLYLIEQVISISKETTLSNHELKPKGQDLYKTIGKMIKYPKGESNSGPNDEKSL